MFSAFRVPAVANMMVVSRSAMIPDTAVAAVIHAWVPLFPAWRADSTKDTCRQRGHVRGRGGNKGAHSLKTLIFLLWELRQLLGSQHSLGSTASV